MLNEDAMPVPANPDKPHDAECVRRVHDLAPCDCSKADEDDEADAAPRWEPVSPGADPRLGGAITWPDGASLFLQGDRAAEMLAEIEAAPHAEPGILNRYRDEAEANMGTTVLSRVQAAIKAAAEEEPDRRITWNPYDPDTADSEHLGGYIEWPDGLTFWLHGGDAILLEERIDDDPEYALDTLDEYRAVAERCRDHYLT